MNDLPAPLRPHVEALAGSRIREVANSGIGRSDILALWFGEGDRATPQFICDAAAEAMRAGKTFYTNNSGIPELRDAIATYLTGLHKKKFDRQRISVTASGVSAIMLVMELLVDPGDNVVIVTPLWPNCADAVEIMGGEARRVALTPGERGWTLDLEKLFAACDSRTRAILINSPGNPTGWMMSAEDLAQVLAFCRKKRIWAVMDEVYQRIVYDCDHAPSLLDIAGPDDPVISVNSFSKAWCMTGWRLGWIVAPAALSEPIGKVYEFNMSHAATFSQYGGIAALQKGESFIAEIVAQYRQSRDIVLQRLGGMRRVRMPRPDAAFYAFFQVDGERDSLTFAKRLVAEAGVGLAPGIAFGGEGEGWLRLCFATSPKRLSEALDRLEPFFT